MRTAASTSGASPACGDASSPPARTDRTARPGGLAAALARHPDGTIVEIWAVPGASRSSIVGLHGSALKVRVASPPERGRANEEIAELLAGVVGASAELVSGRAGRRKRYLLKGVTPAAAAARLGEESAASGR